MTNMNPLIESLKTVIHLGETKVNNQKIADEAIEILTEAKNKLTTGGYIPSTMYRMKDGEIYDPRKLYDDIKTYYLGIVKLRENREITNKYAYNLYTEDNISDNKLESRFPLIIQLLSERENWKLLDKEEAFSIKKIDYVVSNTSYVITKANISEKMILTSEANEFIDKSLFYKRFYNKNSDMNFIPEFISFDRNMNILNNYDQNIWDPFRDKIVVLKPNTGYASIGIKTILLNKNTFNEIKKHVFSVFHNNNNYYDYEKWTISVFIESALYYHDDIYRVIYEKSLNNPSLWNDKQMMGKYVKDNVIYNMPSWKNLKKNGFVTRPRVYMLITKNNNNYELFYYKFMHIIRSARGVDYNIMNTGNLDDLAVIVGSLRDPIFSNNKNIKKQYRDKMKYIYISNANYYKQVWNNDKQKIKSIKNQITYICNTIFDSYKNILICKSEQNNCYSLVALDLVIANVNDNPKIYLTEVNTTPLLKGYYSSPNSINTRSSKGNSFAEIYIPDLVNEMLFLTVDKYNKPRKYVRFEKNNKNEIIMIKEKKEYESYPSLITSKRNFINIKQDNIIITRNDKFYVPQQIIQKYPFIYRALKKRNNISPTKNPYIDIALLYGLRELYHTDKYSFAYYDEIVNYLLSVNIKNAEIVNKIQGITYYLASKDKLYHSLQESYDEAYYDFHPFTIIFIYDGKKNELLKKLEQQIKNVDFDTFIVKPVFGSQGKGISRFNRNEVNNIVNFIDDIATNGIVRNPPDSGVDKYNYWMISQYLDKPWLFERRNEFLYGENRYITAKVKTNMRFYVLLVIKSDSSQQDFMTAYIANRGVMYLAMNSYDINSFDKEVIITNLQVAKDNYAKYNIPDHYAAQNYTYIFPKYYDAQPNKPIKSAKIMEQFNEIVKTTIDSVMYNLRCINRFSDKYKGCFNLLAYDTQLDEDGKLWLIEVNRGPDLAGLAYNLTRDNFVNQDQINNKNDNLWAITNFFDDIFYLTLDSLKDKIDPDYQLRYFTHKISFDYDPYDYNKRLIVQKLQSLYNDKIILLNRISSITGNNAHNERTNMFNMLQEHNIKLEALNKKIANLQNENKIINQMQDKNQEIIVNLRNENQIINEAQNKNKEIIVNLQNDNYVINESQKKNQEIINNLQNKNRNAVSDIDKAISLIREINNVNNNIYSKLIQT